MVFHFRRLSIHCKLSISRYPTFSCRNSCLHEPCSVGARFLPHGGLIVRATTWAGKNHPHAQSVRQILRIELCTVVHLRSVSFKSEQIDSYSNGQHAAHGHKCGVHFVAKGSNGRQRQVRNDHVRTENPHPDQHGLQAL